MKRTIIFAAFFLYLSAIALCEGGCQSPCYLNYYLNITDYKTSADIQTPNGIAVRTNGQEVDLEKIDALTDYVEACLGIEIQRSCLSVVIPNDWYPACEGENEQVFPCRIDPQVCADKGLPIDPDCVPGQLPDEDCPCPCNCRATIQDENTIVTAPNLKLYSAELIRMVTGVNNIWINEATRRCYIAPESL